MSLTLARSTRRLSALTTLAVVAAGLALTGPPTQAAPAPDARFVQVDAGNAGTIALTADGSVYTWGSDSEGQLGDGAPWGAAGGSARPVEITDAFGLDEGHRITKVRAGAWAGYAISDDGRLWAWGMGIHGQLGTGTTDNQPAPVPVDLGTAVVDVAAGLHFAAALTSTGEVKVWGANNYGQAADVGLADKLTPTTLGASNFGGQAITAIGAGRNFAFAITADGTSIYTWGENGDGQLGTSSTTTSANPVPARVSFNPGGIHKINDGESLIRAVGGGHHAAVVSDAGRVWTWGRDDHGQLGRPSIAQDWLPRLIQGDDLPAGWTTSAPVSVDLGHRHSVAVTGDGRVWTWGADTTTDLTADPYTGADLTTATEVALPDLPEGDTVVSAAAGYNHTALLTAQGRILTFGLGDHGRLGLGDTGTRAVPSPVQLDAVDFHLGVTWAPAVGATQTAVVSGASATAAYSYAWLRNGVEIVGASAASYVATGEDVGSILSVRVTASAGNRATGQRTASAGAAVAPPIIDKPRTDQPAVRHQTRISQFKVTKVGKSRGGKAAGRKPQARKLTAVARFRADSGSWTPVAIGTKVRVEVRKSGRWRSAKTIKTTKGGVIRTRVRAAQPRQYRLVLPKQRGYLATTSQPRRK